MRILLVASLASIVISVGVANDDHRSTAWIEGFAIFLAVLICSCVQAGNDFQKERQFQKLNQVADDRKKVDFRSFFINFFMCKINICICVHK